MWESADEPSTIKANLKTNAEAAASTRLAEQRQRMAISRASESPP